MASSWAGPFSPTSCSPHLPLPHKGSFCPFIEQGPCRRGPCGAGTLTALGNWGPWLPWRCARYHWAESPGSIGAGTGDLSECPSPCLGRLPLAHSRCPAAWRATAVRSELRPRSYYSSIDCSRWGRLF